MHFPWSVNELQVERFRWRISRTLLAFIFAEYLERCSSNLEHTHNSSPDEIYLLFFYMALTFAFFQADGSAPVSKDCLNIDTNTGAIISA